MPIVRLSSRRIRRIQPEYPVLEHPIAISRFRQKLPGATREFRALKRLLADALRF